MIEAKQLTKFFGDHKAVDEVSFTVEKGEILGFLGPNAAGKSTTMRMLTGYLPPSAGAAAIGGCDIVADSLNARRKMGYLPENAPVYEDMTVTGFLQFIARIRGLSGREADDAVERTIGKCFLEGVRHQMVGTLSKGFNQRVCFAQSILHDPEYLILDEPTDGLDPNQKHEVRSMIREMGRDKAIILSTHILEEVDAVCTRAIIIANGVIQADDTPKGLRARSEKDGSLVARFTVPEGADPIPGLEAVDGVVKTEVMEQDGLKMLVRIYPVKKGDGLAARIAGYAAEQGLALESLTEETGRLDEVFRAITIKQES
ncbi:ABC transporter ATP-binding protein [Desulfatibacillum aliphaticivorans]|uniref:ABC transporter ATP-binding protein n=1 Tax=Desulfatibacillum aliphaticivorans TaxID=218208 RepID=UPI0003FE418C|nr:ATP-binding cassette domain-containing protein [Desulfatibacillum aliphaticivorans]